MEGDDLRTLQEDVKSLQRWRDGWGSGPGAERRIAILEVQFAVGRWFVILVVSALIVSGIGILSAIVASP